MDDSKIYKVLELKFEVLIEEDEDPFSVLDDAYYALNKVRRIVEVDTSDYSDLGVFHA